MSFRQSENHSQKRFSNAFLFFLITGICAVISVIYLACTRGQALDSLIFSQGTDRFMDFFNHISYVENPADVYFVSENATFPPLVYLMYLLFNRMLPEGSTVMYDTVATSSVTSYATLLYVVYCCLLSVLLLYTLKAFLKERSDSFVLCTALTFMISNLFIFGVLERGNSVLIVCILLLEAFHLRDSDSPVKRELALILIAVAAGIKMYPAVVGILYLYEKRFKEAARLILYGILSFFVPFIWFGGIGGLKQFLANQQFTQFEVSTAADFTSIKMLYTKLIVERFGIDSGAAGGILLSVLFILLAVWAVGQTQEEWKKLFLFAALMSIAPFWSGDYTRIYMILPAAAFLKEERCQPADYLYAAAFACIFLCDTFSPAKTALSYAGIYLLSIWLILDAICQFLQRHSRTAKASVRA